MYISNMQERQERYAQFWNKENHDRPLISISAPKDNASYKHTQFNGSLRERWWDTQYQINTARERMRNTYYAAESLPMLNPNLGPDIMAAFLGVSIEYGESTSWAHPIVKDWKDHTFKFDEQNEYWKKIVEMTNAFLDDSKGDYLVGVTDIHQAMDALVALRGPETLCLDLYDYEDEVRKALVEVEDAFKIVIDKSYKMISKKQKGMVNWMGIYHPESWYVSSSDFIYMISPTNFDDFSKQSIINEAKIIGNNIFHLDGEGSAVHLDKLLEMPEVHGIQWVYGDGAPTARHWIERYKKIQDAGKLVEVPCTASDIETLINCGL
ncbi:MAG: trimethylamine corrinoid protein 2, partial [Niameybacter sp.]